jgi:hypothetical protein
MVACSSVGSIHLVDKWHKRVSIRRRLARQRWRHMMKGTLAKSAGVKGSVVEFVHCHPELRANCDDALDLDSTSTPESRQDG